MYKKINLIKIEFAYQKDERFFELKSHQQVQWYINDVSVVIESFIIHTYEEQKSEKPSGAEHEPCPLIWTMNDCSRFCFHIKNEDLFEIKFFFHVMNQRL